MRSMDNTIGGIAEISQNASSLLIWTEVKCTSRLPSIKKIPSTADYAKWMKISNMKELSQSPTDTLMKCSTRTISARVHLCVLLARVKTAPMLTLPWKMSLLSDQLSKARTTSLWLTMDLPLTKRSIVTATVLIQTGGALNLVTIAIQMLPFKKDLAFAEERISRPRLAPTSTTSRQPSHRIVSEDATR